MFLIDTSASRTCYWLVREGAQYQTDQDLWSYESERERVSLALSEFWCVCVWLFFSYDCCSNNEGERNVRETVREKMDES